ncbi:Zn(II)2Cys6 transcription factor [Aspergillus novofumigatus IBT 16806]|uniref:Putative C6 finger domain protein n=1 Tax=Aspergillus novofumigatus (strain IBT 16806) TaxID=1392255 RepID=A0A2I1CI13_ASPN1|nr:putative C6 finger domain protein [Aspergillus novofumigatus IBT 16806]PKX97261.1 putative C6 finger domain protein [Aspergillus novofumigatus IBT 16806]
METEQGRRIRARRTHQKSRLGCKTCKKRRVKCDEKKPTCTNCRQHAVICDYATESAAPSRPSRRQYRFRQSKYEVQIDSPMTTDTSVQSSTDLHLFHHFVTSAASTATEGHDPKHLWDIHVPQWGFAFPSILHLILAFSALHLAHQHPALRAQYLSQADAHFTFGVRSVTTVLASLNEDNCQYIYISAVLICLVYFGHGPRTGEFLVFSETGQAEWLVLMRGVKSILESRRAEIFSGVLEPEALEGEAQVSEELAEELERHKGRIRDVQALIRAETDDPAFKEMYDSALDSLQGVFDEVYRMRAAGKHGVNLMHLVIGWLYRLPEGFVGWLEAKDPLALAVLAYWTILLKHMQSSWLMTGWHEHVLAGIHASLPEEYRRWIRWPVECIFGDRQPVIAELS